jgi:hypothetical protein
LTLRAFASLRRASRLSLMPVCTSWRAIVLRGTPEMSESSSWVNPRAFLSSLMRDAGRRLPFIVALSISEKSPKFPDI